jgi:hypothetical protein
MTSQSGTPAAAPFGLYSIHFNFPGGQAIEMRDPETDLPIGGGPEWVTQVRNDTAAYVRATIPSLRVLFHGPPAANGAYTIGADGFPFQVAERKVNLTFNPANGWSAPEVFHARTPLPDVIGVHAAKMDWYIRTLPGPSACLTVGTSTHRLCTAWRALTPNSGQDLEKWVYEPLMLWTCEWAAGRDSEKDICDAIIANVAKSGLRYGWPLRPRRAHLDY